LPDQDRWREVLKRRGVSLLLRETPAEPPCLILPHQTGLIAGSVFERGEGGHERVKAVSSEEIEAWRASGCKRFTARYWGNYLIFFHDLGGDKLHILRDPTGSWPCYDSEVDGVDVVVTHAADFLALDPGATPDEDYLRAFIAHSRTITRRTAIAGLSEILPGEQIVFDRSHRTSHMFWWPNMCGEARQGFEAAANRIRAETIAAAGAWARDDGAIVHQLSGGLDSSAALAAMRQGAPDAHIVCLNERPLNAPEGDERRFARISAARAGAQLLEIAFDPTSIDYAALRTPELTAKPSIAHLSFATAIDPGIPGDGFTLMTTGKGGDQLFQRSAPSAVAVEAARHGLSLRACIEAALDVAVRNKISVWGVLGAQVLHGLLRLPQRQDFSPAPLAVDAGRETALKLLLDHPWLQDERRLTPAGAMRTRRVMDLGYYHAANVWSERLPCAHVLTSQPIVEACLATPAYLMIAGGGDRALERAAFADLLDETIVKRTAKGDTTRYFTAAMERAMPFMRETLIGGELARLGCVDAAALQRALGASVLPAQSIKANLMACLVAELWLRRFRQERENAARQLTQRDAA
jgi:asparagine synthase (glutamine-hydrolysing)